MSKSKEFGEGVKTWAWAPMAARMGCVVAGATLLALPEIGLAADTTVGGGGADDDFEDIWETLVGWSQGTLGRVIALGFIVIGLIRGMAAGSIMAFALGVGAGLGLYNAERIVDTIMGADVQYEAFIEHVQQSRVIELDTVTPR